MLLTRNLLDNIYKRLRMIFEAMVEMEAISTIAKIASFWSMVETISGFPILKSMVEMPYWFPPLTFSVEFSDNFPASCP